MSTFFSGVIIPNLPIVVAIVISLVVGYVWYARTPLNRRPGTFLGSILSWLLRSVIAFGIIGFIVIILWAAVIGMLTASGVLPSSQ